MKRTAQEIAEGGMIIRSLDGSTIHGGGPANCSAVHAERTR
jgi:hypothetical protein